MSKRASISHHVRTSIVARVIFRLICLILIAVGLFGLFLTFLASETALQYNRRTDLGIAKVVEKNKEVDDFNYPACTLKYDFVIDENTYTSESTIPRNYNCNVNVGEDIEIRYQADYPENNSYGDSEFGYTILNVATIAITVISIFPLGIGFIGLIAIHKALKTENKQIEEDNRRLARRHARERQVTNSMPNQPTKEK